MLELVARPWLETRSLLGEGLQLFPTGEIYWVDIAKGEIHRIKDGQDRLIHHFDHEVSKVLPWQHGYLVMGREFIHGFNADDLEILSFRVNPDDSNLRCSDAAVLPDGSLVVGILDRDLAPGLGSLLRITTEWEIEMVVEKATIPNGAAVGNSGRSLTWVDSPTQELISFDLADAGPKQAVSHPFTKIDSNLGTPDGIAIDAAGGCWVCLWGGAKVVRVNPSGEIDAVIELGTLNPTSCTFDRDSNLLITTALATLSDVEQQAPGAGGIWIVRGDQHGQHGLPALVARHELLHQPNQSGAGVPLTFNFKNQEAGAI